MTGIRKTCSGWGLALRGLRVGDLKGATILGNLGLQLVLPVRLGASAQGSTAMRAFEVVSTPITKK